MTELLCPSAEDRNGTIELGIGEPLQRLAFSRVRKPRDTRATDLSTMRLAGPCITSDCMNWNDGCNLGKTLAETAVRLRLNARPHCPIRRDCRWFAENGRAACGACALVRFQ